MEKLTEESLLEGWQRSIQGAPTKNYGLEPAVRVGKRPTKRSLAFGLFDKGIPSAEVAKQLRVAPYTANEHYCEWNILRDVERLGNGVEEANAAIIALRQERPLKKIAEIAERLSLSTFYVRRVLRNGA